MRCISNVTSLNVIKGNIFCEKWPQFSLWDMLWKLMLYISDAWIQRGSCSCRIMNEGSRVYAHFIHYSRDTSHLRSELIFTSLYKLFDILLCNARQLSNTFLKYLYCFIKLYCSSGADAVKFPEQWHLFLFSFTS